MRKKNTPEVISLPAATQEDMDNQPMFTPVSWEEIWRRGAVLSNEAVPVVLQSYIPGGLPAEMAKVPTWSEWKAWVASHTETSWEDIFGMHDVAMFEQGHRRVFNDLVKKESEETRFCGTFDEVSKAREKLVADLKERAQRLANDYIDAQYMHRTSKMVAYRDSVHRESILRGRQMPDSDYKDIENRAWAFVNDNCSDDNRATKARELISELADVWFAGQKSAC